MKINIWAEGQFKESSLIDLKSSFNHPSWINISDPTVEDLEKVARLLDMPKHILVGKLRSNYSHVDTYPEHTKIFSWYLSQNLSEKGVSFNRSPVIILSNKVSAITISSSKIGLYERITKGLEEETSHSMSARIIYITLMYLLESHEYFAEQIERQAERFEEAIPPWPRNFYVDSFNIRKNASRFLRLLKHFRALVEFLAKKRTYLSLTEEEKRIFDVVYDRTIGAEESTEMSLETIRDLINMHLDTISHDMNKAMRFMAAITSIVAIPSVIGAFLGMNLIDVPWPWELWQVAIVSILVALSLTAFFYRKGWLKGV